MADNVADPHQLRRSQPARSSGRKGDVVIVGAGLAGLFTALKLAPMPVTVLAAAPLGEGASSIWAQGGIAAAVGADDSPALHAADTIAAGAGIVDEAVARFVTGGGARPASATSSATACPSIATPQGRFAAEPGGRALAAPHRARRPATAPAPPSCRR